MEKKHHLSLKQLDEWIREGKSKRVRYELKRLSTKSLSREELYSYSDIARRAQMPHLIIRWLRPYVHPQTPGEHILKTKEVALYGLALARIGAFKEATETLKKLNEKENPQVSFYQGLAYVDQWNYEAALIPFQKYVKRKDITEYQRTVGLLNLTACHVGTMNWKQVQNYFQILKSRADVLSSTLLKSNILELEAQSLILQKDYLKAEKVLDESLSFIGKDNFQYELFIRKWKAILIMAQNTHSNTPLSLIRQEAHDNGFFETVRDCDFFNSYLSKDESRFLQLYFGSHFTHYKKRILKLYGWEKPLPLTHKVCIGPDQGDIYSLDIKSLFLTAKTRQLLILLLSDIYRPFSLPEIFSEIYSHEYFNPLSSKKRVSQLVATLRSSLKKQQVPLDIEIRKGLTFLRPLVKIEIQLERKSYFFDDKVKSHLTLLEKELLNQKFTSLQAAKVLNVSPRTSRRILEKAAKAKWVKREQKQKEYVYQIELAG